MAIAISSFPNLFASLHDLLAGLAPRRSAAGGRVPARAAAAVPRAPLRPLRVVRVLEPSAPRSVAGRMVISGRMVDVCAELDRLAAQETR